MAAHDFLAVGKILHMERKSENYSEVIFQTAQLALGCAIIVISVQYGFGNLNKPGPGLYTVFIGLFMTVCSLWNVVSLVKETKGRQALFQDRSEVKKMAMVMASFILWVLGMPYLGYAAISFLAAFAIAKVMGLEGWVKPLVLSLSTSLLIYVLFDYFLYIDLPRGILG